MAVMAQRQIFIVEDELEPHPPAPAPAPIYFNDTVVRVQVIDEPQRQPHDGTCRCEACRAAHLADWAERFLP
jgi:hypothetical protein